jgi:hypothetical protein
MNYILDFIDFCTEVAEIPELKIEYIKKAKELLMDEWGYDNYEVIYNDGEMKGFIFSNDSCSFHTRVDFKIKKVIKTC